jgi:DNA-binding MarR family transcriptional regulator
MSVPIALIGLVIGAAAILRAIGHRDSGQDAADILALLWTQDGPISQSDICRNRNIRTQDVVAGLARLEELGLVRREWDSNSRTDLFRALKQGGREGRT